MNVDAANSSFILHPSSFAPSGFYGRNDDRHPVSLDVRARVLGCSVLLDVVEQAVEHGPAELHVRHFPAAEADDGLYLVAMLQEAQHVVLLELEVVLVDAGSELHLLDDDHLLLLLRLALFLLLLEDELPVIHDLADGRFRGRRDLHEVEVFFPGHFLGLLNRHDADLRALGVNEANLTGAADHLVDSGLGFSGFAVESSVAAWRVNANSSCLRCVMRSKARSSRAWRETRGNGGAPCPIPGSVPGSPDPSLRSGCHERHNLRTNPYKVNARDSVSRRPSVITSSIDNEPGSPPVRFRSLTGP